jgi:signal transduction histidine kinase
MLERLRQSLALRLAAQYALVFALSSGVLFGVLYWTLAEALNARELAGLERQVRALADSFGRGSPVDFIARVKNSPSPEMSASFVRLITPDGSTYFQKLPDDWIETQVKSIPFGAFTLNQEVSTVRIPQTALRDYSIATFQWPTGVQLQVGRILDSRAVLLAPLKRAFALTGAGALVLSFGVGIVLAWRATRPLRAVSATARRILETGDLAARVPSAGNRGELATLVTQLNTLLDKNAAHVRVLRETLDHLAHDLRTPLTRLRGTAELAMQDAGDPAEARAALADCVNESDRVLHLLEVLLDISAAEAGALKLNRDHLDVRTLVERAADLYREVAEEKNITVVVDQPAPAECQADAIRLGQAINNLVDNALKYTPAGGTVTLTTAVERGTGSLPVLPEKSSPAQRGTNFPPVSSRDHIVITVADTGPGVPVAERDAIWRRLYRGDSSRSQRGLGLGLSLVKAIVEAHGGTATISEAPHPGARFTLSLPV